MRTRFSILWLGLACAGLGTVATLHTPLASLPASLPATLPWADERATPAPDQASQGATAYYCPMHPSYRSDHPGECPVCNMNLIPFEEQAQGGASSVTGRAAVTIRPEQRQLVGVRTARAEKRPVHKTIRAAARVDYDERKLAVVNLKIGGWVEELFVRATGESVKKGDPLFALYSPELYEAEMSYALLVRARSAAPEAGQPSGALQGNALLAAARERLLRWDVSAEELAELEAGKEPARRSTIRARVQGVVTQRNVVEGSSVEPGRNLFELADLSSVWVQADVYEFELASLAVGQAAEIEIFSLPGERFRGEIDYVYPYLDEATRTQRVRIEVANADGRLKPAMYGAATIAVDLGERLVIDEAAVLDTGKRQLVFVELGDGRFEPREVALGERGEGWVVVSSGVEPGETVVTSGNFLIDSESRLRAALLGQMAGMDMPGMVMPGTDTGGKDMGHGQH